MSGNQREIDLTGLPISQAASLLMHMGGPPADILKMLDKTIADMEADLDKLRQLRLEVFAKWPRSPAVSGGRPND